MNTRRGYIYVIINKLNGKYYYGKTFNIKSRWIKHKVNATKKINRRLYDSMNCHGYDNFFIFKISEIECDKTLITKKLNELETYFISLTDAKNPNFGYNMTDGGDGGNCGEEGIQKMINKKTGVKLTQQHKDNIGKGNKGKNIGKIHSEKQNKQTSERQKDKTYEEIYGIETAKLKKEHASKTMKGRKRKPFSKEWKKNIGKASSAYHKKQRDLKISTIDIKEIETLLKNNIPSRDIPKIFKVDIRFLNVIFLEKYGLTLYKYSKTL